MRRTKRSVASDIFVDPKVSNLIEKNGNQDSFCVFLYTIIRLADDEGRFKNPLNDPSIRDRMIREIFKTPDSRIDLRDSLLSIEFEGLAVSYYEGRFFFLPAWFDSNQNIPRPQPSQTPIPPPDLLLRYPRYLNGLVKHYQRTAAWMENSTGIVPEHWLRGWEQLRELTFGSETRLFRVKRKKRAGPFDETKEYGEFFNFLAMMNSQEFQALAIMRYWSSLFGVRRGWKMGKNNILRLLTEDKIEPNDLIQSINSYHAAHLERGGDNKYLIESYNFFGVQGRWLEYAGHKREAF